MSKISNAIRKKAKSLRKQNQSKKLTSIQNELAIADGFKSFKDLLRYESRLDRDKRIRFAKSDIPDAGDHFAYVNNKVEVFIRSDGLRGVRALVNIDEGDEIFNEKAFLWVIESHSIRGEGLAWTMTRNIVTKFPEIVQQMETIGRLRESFRPKLDEQDRGSLKSIASFCGTSESFVHKVYNLVCTYNVVNQLQLVDPVNKTFSYGCRMTISKGLAYANHSCEPNAELITFFSMKEFNRMINGLVAVKKIGIGEEIAWSYFGDYSSRRLKDRQKRLKREFGFDCNCQRCLREKYKSY